MALTKGRKKVTVRSLKRSVSKSASVKKEKAAKVSKKVMLDEAQLQGMIQERAYYIWEERGKPAGQDHDIWSQAQSDILAKINK